MSEKIVRLLALLADQQRLDAEVARQEARKLGAEIRLELDEHTNIFHEPVPAHTHDHAALVVMNQVMDLEKAQETAELNRQRISHLLIEINEQIPVPAERT